MSGRRTEVDMGPMYLPVGDAVPQVESGITREDGISSDMKRFRSLMQKSPLSRNPTSMEDPENICDPTQQNLSHTEPDIELLVDDLHYLHASLGDGESVESRREVFVGLKKEILPDTEIHMVEEEGRLHIQFDSQSAYAQALLARSLCRLTRHLGERLSRPLRLTLSSRIEKGRIIATEIWPENSFWESPA